MAPALFALILLAAPPAADGGAPPPAAPPPATAAVPPSLHVKLDGVTVDPGDPGALPPDLEARLPPPTTVPLPATSKGRPGPVFEAASRLRDAHQHLAALLGREPPPLQVRVDPAVPYSAATAALHRATQAGFAKLILETPAGPVPLDVPVLRLMVGDDSGAMPLATRLALHMTPEGGFVVAQSTPADDTPLAMLGTAQPRPVALALNGACPALPKTKDGIDVAPLGELGPPLCAQVRIGATPDTPFGQVAAAVATLRALGGCATKVTLTLPAAVPADCEAAITPADLPARLAADQQALDRQRGVLRAAEAVTPTAPDAGATSPAPPSRPR
ncbi:MAG: hypothetical protein H6704_29570 [Myxococcales bacterium]|nr:hypothetical protein [Myxococcales bacterium]